ncbi:RNA polymerase sigma factor [Streptomyces sp. NPDC046881]|uniref:RNA polymerase sigma factor n=1 Tax=Streptomyces sp. NPDC046881 TaxID=3155374 RepID=UPI0033C6EA78
MAEDQATERAEAVAALAAEQYGQLVGYARKRLRAFDVPQAWVDADDVVQNALASVLARKKPVQKLRPYVFTVVKNEVWRAAQRYRTGQPYGSLDADVQLEAAGPADPIGAADRRLDLADTLDALPPQQRKAVLLNKALEFTQAETATIMNTAPGTVATHVSRGMVTLRVTLGALGLALVAWGTAWWWGQSRDVTPAAGFERVKDLNVWRLALGFSVLVLPVTAVALAVYVSTRPDREPRTWWERLGVRLRKSVKQLMNGPGGFAGND